MRIDLPNRVIEVGNIMYTPAMQRTAGATEAQYLFAAYVFDDLGNRRYEWKCNNLNAPSKRAAERFGFTFEEIFRRRASRSRQGPQPRYRLVLDARCRVAGAQGRLRALARARRFRWRAQKQSLSSLMPGAAR